MSVFTRFDNESKDLFTTEFCFLMLFLYKEILFVLWEIILVCSDIPDEPFDLLFFNELEIVVP